MPFLFVRLHQYWRRAVKDDFLSNYHAMQRALKIGLATSQKRAGINKHRYLYNCSHAISCRESPQQVYQLRTASDQFCILVEQSMMPFCYNLAVTTDPNKKVR